MQKPMLANKFEDKKAEFPCFVQPKLDGVRCLFDGERAWTRNLKDHKPHILRMLQESIPNLVGTGLVLDGELMLPYMYSFQDTVSAVKREQDLSSELGFCIFDCFESSGKNINFKRRKEIIEGLLGYGDSGITIEIVKTRECSDMDQIYEALEEYTSCGFEGLIYRNPNGFYKHGRSGRDLLKLKKFQDAEYVITGVREGQGKDVGTPIFQCETDTGIEFSARPTGTYEWRRQAWNDRDQLIGKVLTVKYQELTKDGVPRFPIGIEIRDYE